MVNDHRPAFLPEATNSVLDGCSFSVRHMQYFGKLPEPSQLQPNSLCGSRGYRV